MAVGDDIFSFSTIYFPICGGELSDDWDCGVFGLLILNLIVTFISGMTLVTASFLIYLIAPIIISLLVSGCIGGLVYVTCFPDPTTDGGGAGCLALVGIILMYWMDPFGYKQFFREKKYIDFFLWGSVTAASLTGLVNLINFIKYYCLAIYHLCMLIGYCCISIFDADCWSSCKSNCSECCSSCYNGLTKCCEYLIACVYISCKGVYKCMEGVCLFIYDGIYYLYDQCSECCCCCKERSHSYENHKHENVISEGIKHIFLFLWKSILFIMIYSYRIIRYCLYYISCKKIRCLESNKCCECCSCSCSNIFSDVVENPYNELLKISCMKRVEKGRKYIFKNILKGFKRLYRYEIFHYAICNIIESVIKRLYLKISGDKKGSVYPDDDDPKTIKIKIDDKDDDDDENNNNGNKIITSSKGSKVPVGSKGTKVAITSKGTKVVISEEEEKRKIIEDNLNIPKDENNTPLFFRLPSRDSINSSSEKKKSIIKLSIVNLKRPSIYQLPCSSTSNKSFRPPHLTPIDIPGSI